MPSDEGKDQNEKLDRPDPLRRMITRTATPFAVALIFGFACPAHAELVPDPALPQFSPADIARIERNATLRNLYVRNPWLTFRVLRAIDEAVETKRDALPSQSPPPTSQPFDEKRDPDLGELQRVAPEAAVDLFALIKKASSSRPAQK
jgi:hypothetical protein